MGKHLTKQVSAEASVTTGQPPNAEEKLKAAATKLFTQQGFDAVKTRDIAREAGINLALLNYYFRSKKNLYRIIMLENFQVFFQGAFRILNQKGPDVPAKIQQVVAYYIDNLSSQPHIPAFVLNEIRTNPGILSNGPLSEVAIKDTLFFSELLVYCEENKININPLHLFLNVVGMVIFPFIAAPIAQHVFKLDKTHFNDLMAERKSLVPQWMQAIIQSHANV